ncbi:hypothetical protein [Rathayibacter festucae]|uniref:hypothetical protein n=1 Tax=Rathayibacter festucae TaxID=110937 RepID=UPI002A6B21AD|nr:hypothetical protein [Rathayibacter festucae]MDY0911424.1 hypothetical protein [Rathayibacter festucae]
MSDVNGSPLLTGAEQATDQDAGEATPDRQESADELRARLDELLNDPLDEWLKHMHVGGVVAAAPYEQTLSWRVTKPLRAVRLFQIRTSQLGLKGAVGHTARYVVRRVGGRG